MSDTVKSETKHNINDFWFMTSSPPHTSDSTAPTTEYIHFFNCITTDRQPLTEKDFIIVTPLPPFVTKRMAKSLSTKDILVYWSWHTALVLCKLTAVRICTHLLWRERGGRGWCFFFLFFWHHASGSYSGLDLLTWILKILAAVLCFKETAYQHTWLKKAARLSWKLAFTFMKHATL